MKYTVNNLSLYVEESGAGALTLIILHYWGGTHRTWHGAIAHLVDRFRCVAYDSRGWGQSEGPDSGYSIRDLADEAEGLIQTLGLKKYILVGHSMGGKVAQLLASRNPLGLAGLILVAPAAPTPTHFPEEAFQQQLHAYDNRETIVQTIGFLSAKPPTREILEQIVEDSLSGSSTAKIAWPTVGIVEDLSLEVSRIAVPTLLLAGEHDNLDSVEQHRREVLSRIANSTLEVIAKSGHLIPIDEPEQLASFIAQFAAKRL